MAFVIADRVRESSVSTGTGNFTLGGAVTGYQTFASALSSGDTTYYTIADQGGANWEVGIGTFTSPSTLSRDTILSSSNSNTIVTFGAGTKDVFISLPASKTNTVAAGNLAFTGTAQRITGDFSNATIANRVMFQTSTTNSSTGVIAIPNGTGTSSTFIVTNSSDVANTSFGQINISTSLGFQLQSSVTGTGTNLPMTFFTAGSERMRLDTSGNVGIGTSSPGSKLEVNQGILTINTSDQSLTRLQLKTTGTGGRTWDLVGGLPGVNNSQFSVYDVTAAATRLTIDSSGNVGIGTTTIGSKLTVNGDVAGTFFVNPTTVSANYTIPTNYNAMTAGPITVNSGITVTVPSGSTWVVA